MQKHTKRNITQQYPHLIQHHRYDQHVHLQSKLIGLPPNCMRLILTEFTWH
jgi:hypothetical protein